jgi:predicted membrane channel-forming protein YqfA (hemolysin III family)
VLILRLAGALWSIFFIIMWILYLIETVAGVNVQRYPVHSIIASVVYVCLGFLLVLVAKPLVRLAGRGLEG